MEQDEKIKTIITKKEYVPPVIQEIIYIEMEGGIANGSGINAGNGGIIVTPWIDNESGGTGEPDPDESKWWE
ncbi:hypothetical protein BEI02_03380 [Elizabethkingia sp. HvH-WGS333]|uniref:hypothetical protein n=1 Tax=Elizabethkingia TaxID=308865 RepID=UPI0008F89E42|nr:MULTISPECIES: hypothetical protein [unclassified Elizabethkingia]MDX8567137.1 hypothetical protein [Elizabethkingia sp. HX XZB]OIK46082.1 hypothetical protein BEI02_03380 [Elizabethkingia sp. HvH-WGS333]